MSWHSAYEIYQYYLAALDANDQKVSYTTESDSLYRIHINSYDEGLDLEIWSRGDSTKVQLLYGLVDYD